MQTEKINPQQVMEMLRKEGRIVSLEQATLILEFLKEMSKHIVLNHFSNNQEPTNDKHKVL